MQINSKRITEGTTAITIRVRELERSRYFYTEVLGMTSAPDPNCQGRAMMLRWLSSPRSCGIRLVQEESSVPAVTLRLELSRADDLLDIYMVARLVGAPTTHFLRNGRELTARIRDPDGNAIELTCPAMRPRSVFNRASSASDRRCVPAGRPGDWIDDPDSRSVGLAASMFPPPVGAARAHRSPGTDRPESGPVTPAWSQDDEGGEESRR